MRNLPGWYWTILLSLFSLGFGLIAPTFFMSEQNTVMNPIIGDLQVAQIATASPTVSIVAQVDDADEPESEEPQVEPTNTLLPPPTFEPSTPTPLPSATPTMTPTQSIVINAEVEGIQGLPSPSYESEVVHTCTTTDEWTLEYTVQNLDTVSSIATQFGTYTDTVVDANCIEDPNMLIVGQVLLVPGETLLIEPAFVCESYVQLQPIEGMWGIGSTGELVFNWTGTDAPRNLLRLYPPDYDFNDPDPEKWIDYTFDLRQNHTINLQDIQAGGTWHWQVIPLDMNFVQVCPESPLYSFHKDG